MFEHITRELVFTFNVTKFKVVPAWIFYLQWGSKNPLEQIVQRFLANKSRNWSLIHQRNAWKHLKNHKIVCVGKNLKDHLDIFDVAQDTIGLLGCKHTFPDHMQFFIHQYLPKANSAGLLSIHSSPNLYWYWGLRWLRCRILDLAVLNCTSIAQACQGSSGWHHLKFPKYKVK